jgi:hypothetical protein
MKIVFKKKKKKNENFQTLYLRMGSMSEMFFQF